MTACDTTLMQYGFGKNAAINKYSNIIEFVKVFLMPNKTHNEIEQISHNTLVVLFSCIPDTQLDFERAIRFGSKVASVSAYSSPLNAFHHHQGSELLTI